MSRTKSAISRKALERLVGESINDESIYVQALRHSSYFNSSDDSRLLSNEQLEYLGDAIIDFVISEILYHRFPDKDEGFLTPVRARIVNGAALAEYATRIDLGEFILMSNDTARAGGRTNVSIVAGAFEALVAAIYLDLGEQAVRRFLNRVVLDELDLNVIADRRDNFKSMLQEYAQARGMGQPDYQVVKEDGPPHDRTFTVEVSLATETLGRGSAGSKKMAEQNAAREAMAELKARSQA